MQHKRIKLLLLTLWLFIGCFYVSADAAAKLSTPVVTTSNVASSGKIKLTWKKVSGAKKYKVYRATSKSGTYKLMKTTTSTSYTNTSASSGKTYYYKVKAVGSSDSVTSAYSSVKTRTCDLPRPVANISNVASSGKIKLSWDAVSGAKEYKVYRATSKSGEYKLMKTTTATSYTNTSAEVGKIYYYKVKAIASKSAADSAYSTVKYRRCDLKKPTITAEINEDGKIKLYWEKIDNSRGYAVYRSVNKDNAFEYQGDVSDCMYIDNTAEVAVDYYYKIRALHSNSEADSVYSNMVSACSVDLNEPLRKMYVNDPQITLYALPENTSESVNVPYMEAIKIGNPKDSNSSWYRAFYQGAMYYVWLPEGNEKLTAEQNDFTYVGNTKYQQQVVDFAAEIAREWNTIYVSGQSKGIQNPDGTYGFDCSGFVGYVLNTVMQKVVPAYKAPTSVSAFYSADVIYNKGYKGEFCAMTVELADIQPGDVIIFSLKETNDHCGIYLGNNEFAHSVIGFDGVVIAPIKGIYLEKINAIRRVLPEKVTAANQTRYLKSSCGQYSEMNTDSKVGTFKKGEEVTVLYSNSKATWTYVRTQSGKKVFISGDKLSKTQI